MNKLINHRDSHKRSVLRLETSSQALDVQSPSASIESSLDLLEEYWIKFQNVQLAIEEKCSDEEQEKVYKEMTTVEASFLKTKTFLKTLLDQQRIQRNADNNVQNPNNSARDHNVKLPKMTVPVFDGSFCNWSTFRDLFQSMIGNQAKLTDGEKLQYLVPNVKGEAEDIVKEYEINDANYAAAWAALENRFENKRLQVKAHLTMLFGQEVLTSEDAEALRKLMRTTQKCLRSLKSLGGPVEQWDWLLVHITVDRLDPKTRRYWELIFTSKEAPTWQELVTALEIRCNALEAEKPTNSKKVDYKTLSSSKETTDRKKTNTSSSTSKVLSSVSSKVCSICTGSHECSSCKEFLAQNLDGRLELVHKHKLCFKCLKSNHNFQLCKAAKCGKCNKRHHELLHNSKRSSSNTTGTTSNATVSSNTSNTSVQQSNHSASQNHALVTSNLSTVQSQILLSTALVKVRALEGNWIILRAFLDGGAQRNVITEECVQRLRLKRFSCEVPVTGIGELNAGTYRKGAIVPLKSCVDSSFQMNLNAVVMKSISTDLPNVEFDISKWSYLHGLTLADAKFNEPGKVDLLIGAEFYLSLLKNEPQVTGPIGCPVAQNTHLGWILSGPVVSTKRPQSSKIFSLRADQSLSEVLSRFWEIEEIPNISTKSLEDKKCEEHFDNTFSRAEDGRFIVKLPFNDERLCFGETRTTAVKRFDYLERRFSKDRKLHHDYVDQIRELESLGHAKLADMQQESNEFYLPHHAVIKPERTTTKMRIVFDAAAKSSNGVSLNDKLMVGPRLQEDLLRILIRFRSYCVVVSADIEKMFRQIFIALEDRKYQKFVWRECAEDALKEFLLSTVVFGTSCAPYLAVKCLQKLANLECNEISRIRMVILEDFFMDDLLTGGDKSEEVIQLVAELQEVLEKGKFTLRKWISNDETVLQSIDNSVKAFENIFDVPFQDSCKALGLRWHPGADVFGYKVQIDLEKVPLTKRSIMSVIASLYDPLGLLAPVVIKAKILLQRIWISGVEWDVCVNDDISKEWNEFYKNLLVLNDIVVPRWLGTFTTNWLELHGFSDASDDAYSAVVYVRTRRADRNFQTNIVAAKTRVAPVKRISTPKLELCGAVLLTRLMRYVIDSLKLEKIILFAWCDNTAVLDWLRKQPIHWKAFVANRTSEIQSTFPSMSWRYVPSEDNPADCASRGVNPNSLKSHKLWWNGPSWLTQDESCWPKLISPTNPEAESEARKSVLSCTMVVPDDRFDKLARKFSSLNKLKNVVAYVIRFIDIARGKDKRNIGLPNVLELEEALKLLIKLAQRKHFSESLDRLKANKHLERKDKLLPLNPFIDGNGLMRVGGRLSNSLLQYNEKFPIILPKIDSITQLIVRDVHLNNFHAGITLMISQLRRQYWIIGARVLVKQCTRNCIKCVRVKGLTSGQIMGDLPTVRVTGERAFLRSAVDYAGPIQIKVPTINVRKFGITKGYIAVFVCLATKCIHLEVASDQTSEKFLEAYKRFSARRGTPRELRSDHGSNFVGSKNELARLQEMLQSQIESELIRKSLAKDGTDWSMVPAHTPHFNGLCEAAVKSAKYHLRRVLRQTPFTFEEMATILCQIEAILNSRPLIPQSDDINDLNVLTPGHFLIGEQMTAIPEPNLQYIQMNRLNRYQLMQRQVQDFWSKWNKDYLSTLQQRTKWKTPIKNLKVGQLVTIKDDESPPTKWLMARVVKIKPGKDNHVRVAQLRTAKVTGQIKPGKDIREMVAELKTNYGVAERSVHNLCVLPMDDEELDS